MRDHHFNDCDLALALDGELPTHRQAAIDAHLVECASCRKRQMNMEDAAELAIRLCQPAEGGEWHGASRTRLQSALLEEARTRKVSFGERCASIFLRVPPWAVLSAGVLASVILGRAVSSEFQAVGTEHSIEKDSLPVVSLTPGATWNVSVEELCNPVRREPRPIAAAVRHQVLRGYRMEHVPLDQYELDYLITPELGGAPDVQNLWPQRYASRTWNAYVKDQLEGHLPKLVCDGTLSLRTAQRDIAVDWIAAYKKYFRTDLPLQSRANLERGTGTSTDDDLSYPVWRTKTSPTLVLVSFAASR